MGDGLRAAIDQIKSVVAGLEPACFSASDAAGLFELFAEGERLCAAGKALLAARVADSGLWRQAGERSAAHWVARRSGSTISAAASAIETGARMEDLPSLDAKFRAGGLSEVQAREIASTAAANPAAVSELIEVAASQGIQGLRDACRRVSAAAVSDEGSRQAAIRRGRYFKTWVDPDGAGRLDVRTTVDDLARVLAGVEVFEAEIFEAARVSGSREPYHAYAADALVAMALAAVGSAPPASGGEQRRASRPEVKVNVLISDTALQRGHSEPGETSEIAGVGPVAVATVRAMMADSFLAAVVTDGVDVYNVAHLGRTVTAHQRTALEVRDRECVIDGCHARGHLEIDHVDGWSATRVTKLDRLARLCHFHHHQKTYEGYRLEGTPGHWVWLKPDGTAAHLPP
jgi:hypothetical protein